MKNSESTVLKKEEGGLYVLEKTGLAHDSNATEPLADKPVNQASQAHERREALDHLLGDVDEWLGRIGYKPDPLKQHAVSDSHLVARFDEHRSAAQSAVLAHYRSPWAVHRLADLVSIFGLFFWTFLLLQLASALMLGKVAAASGAWSFDLAASALLVLAFAGDWAIYKLLRGRAYQSFMGPAMVWGAITILPGLGTYLFRTVSALLMQPAGG